MSSPEEWYWISGEENVADMITRGCQPRKLGEGSLWQNGPGFLALPENERAINKQVEVQDIPERRRCEFSGLTDGGIEEKNNGDNHNTKTDGGSQRFQDCEDTLSKRIDINRFSKLKLLINTTARILKLYKRFKKDGVKETEIKPEDIYDAEIFWIREAQVNVEQDIIKGRYIKLQPNKQNGIYLVGGSTDRSMEATWNRQEFTLLPKEHQFYELVAAYQHNKSGNLGCAATVSRIRSKYWIIGIRRVINRLINNCVVCKKSFIKFAVQRISPLPVERIKTSPPFF